MFVNSVELGAVMSDTVKKMRSKNLRNALRKGFMPGLIAVAVGMTGLGAAAWLSRIGRSYSFGNYPDGQPW